MKNEQQLLNRSQIQHNCKYTADFDKTVSRAGSHSEKYDSLKKYFGTADATPLWVADQDIPTPEFIVSALAKRAAHPLFGYTEQYDEIFNAVIWWMQNEHSVYLEKTQISLSPSVQTIILNAIRAISKPGDGILIMTPVYGPFFTAVQSTGRKLIDYPLPVKNNRFIFDGNSFERAIKNSRPAALLFCNPHNPGGRVWTKSEIETIVKICVQNSVKIISDEIHSDIIFPPSVHTSILTVDDAKNISIAAHSAGKTFNTAGLDASFVMIPNPEIKALFDKEAAAGHTGNINIFGKTALCAALTPCGAEYKKLLIDHLKQSTSMVCRQLQEEPRIKVMVPEATYLVWADFSALGQWPAVMRLLLHDAKVALSGGTFFGPAGKGWFRINCAHPSSQLQPAVNRIIQTFNNSE